MCILPTALEEERGDTRRGVSTVDVFPPVQGHLRHASCQIWLARMPGVGFCWVDPRSLHFVGSSWESANSPPSTNQRLLLLIGFASFQGNVVCCLLATHSLFVYSHRACWLAIGARIQISLLACSRPAEPFDGVPLPNTT